MRAVFRVSGGGVGYFPGLATPRTIDVDALAPEEREDIEALIEQTRFFELPTRLPSPPGAADVRTYEITIEDGTRRHRIVVCEPARDPALQALIDRLRRLGTRQQNPGDAGGGGLP